MSQFSPFDMAGFGLGMPETTLDSPVSTTGGGGTNWVDVVNSIGSIVLGGILISRTPKEKLPTVQQQAVPAAAPRTTPAANGFTTEKVIQFAAIGGIVLVIVILIMRMAKGSGE